VEKQYLSLGWSSDSNRDFVASLDPSFVQGRNTVLQLRGDIKGKREKRSGFQ